MKILVTAFLFITILSSCEKGGAIKVPVFNFYDKVVKQQIYTFPDAMQYSEVTPFLSTGFISKLVFGTSNNQLLTKIEASREKDWSEQIGVMSSHLIFTSFEIKEILMANYQARVRVEFTYAENGKKWIDTIHMIQESGYWKIDNIAYSEHVSEPDFRGMIQNAMPSN